MKKRLLLMFMVLMSAVTLWAGQLIIDQPNHGNISASPSSPNPGDLVTLTVDLDAGYDLFLSNLVAQEIDTDDNPMGSPLTVTFITNDPLNWEAVSGSYTFTMPFSSYDVKVTATLTPRQNVVHVNIDPLSNGTCIVSLIDGMPATPSGPDNYDATTDQVITLDPIYGALPEIASYYVLTPPGFSLMGFPSMIVDASGMFTMPPINVEVYPNFKMPGTNFVNIDPNNEDLTVTASPPYAIAGDPVTLNIQRNHPDIELTDICIKGCISGQTIGQVYVQNGQFMFDMPGEDVVVDVKYERVPDAQTNHQVFIDPGITYGTVSTDYPDYGEYDLVKLNISPDPGCTIVEVFIEGLLPDLDPNVKILPDPVTNEYRFSMPRRDVTVRVTFDRGTPYTLEVERGNPNIGDMEIFRINGVNPPTPTLNGNNYVYHPVYAGDVIEIWNRFGAGYRLQEGILVDTYDHDNRLGSFNGQYATITMPAQDATLLATWESNSSTVQVDWSKVSVLTTQTGHVQSVTRNGNYDVYIVDNHGAFQVTDVATPGYDIAEYILEDTDGNILATYPTSPGAREHITIDVALLGVQNVILTANYVPLQLTLQVENNNPDGNMFVAVNGSPDGPVFTDSSYDYYKVQFNDIITIQCTPRGGYVLDEYDLEDTSVPGVAIARYAGIIADYTMPANDVTLKAVFRTASTSSYTLKVDKNTLGGLVNLAYIAGNTPNIYQRNPPAPPYADYDVYDGININDNIDLAFNPNPYFIDDICDLIDANDPNNLIWTQPCPVYNFPMPGQDVALTAKFTPVVVPFTLQVERNPVGGSMFLVVNGAFVYPFSSNAQYDFYTVNANDTITAYGYPNNGYVLQDFILEDTNIPANIIGTYPPLDQPDFALIAMPYQDAILRTNFVPAYTLEVDQNTSNGILTDVYVNGVLMAPTTLNSFGNYEYYPVIAGDVITVRNLPDAGYKAIEYKYIDSGSVTTTFNPNVNPPVTATFTMPADNVMLTATFNLASYAINIMDVDGVTMAYSDLGLSTQISSAALGDTVYLGFTPNTGYVFDPVHFSVTYSVGADAQPQFLQTSPPYTSAMFVMQQADNIDVHVVYQPIYSDIVDSALVNGTVNIQNLTTSQATYLLGPPITAVAGDSIQMQAAPDLGYNFGYFEVYDWVADTLVGQTRNTVIEQRPFDMKISAVFYNGTPPPMNNPLSVSLGEEPVSLVSIDTNSVNGSISMLFDGYPLANNANVYQGAEVEVVLTPDPGYQVTNFTVETVDSKGARLREIVPVTEGEEMNTYYFIMPGKPVNIYATFGVDEESQRGDVNGDGTIDIDDVTALISRVLGFEVSPFIPANADVNGDKNLDIDDVTMTISHILNGVWP